MGYKVAIIDDFSAKTAKIISPKIKVYKIDVDNVNDARKIFKKEKPDFVYHLAGAINLRRQIKDPLFIKDFNILVRTKIILDACLENNVKKIIFISSGGAIYENAKVIPTPENYSAHPLSLYGLANLMIEKYIELYCKESGLSFIILRLSNVYGPRQWESGIIPSIIIRLIKKEKPTINGDGIQTRDFIYIDDVIDAFIIATKKEKTGIYNVGSNKEISLNEVFKLINELLNTNIKPIYNNNNVAENKRSAVDTQKIKKDFGWNAKTDIKTGILKVIEWYKKNGKL